MALCRDCGSEFKPRCHQKRCDACLDRVRTWKREGFKPKTCKGCGTDFTPTGGTQLYCSVNCRPKYQPPEPEPRSCRQCGAGFIPLANQRYCTGCRPHRKRRRAWRYKQFKASTCARCGFVAKHSAQLDIHHRDGNAFNDDPANLETICANCHRLETWQAKTSRARPSLQAERRAEEFERRVRQLSLTLPASTARKVAYKEFN